MLLVATILGLRYTALGFVIALVLLDRGVVTLGMEGTVVSPLTIVTFALTVLIVVVWTWLVGALLIRTLVRTLHVFAFVVSFSMVVERRAFETVVFRSLALSPHFAYAGAFRFLLVVVHDNLLT